MSLRTTLIGWHETRVEFRDVTHLARWAVDKGVRSIELFLVDDDQLCVSPVTGRTVEGRMRVYNLLGEQIAEAPDEPVYTARQRWLMCELDRYFLGILRCIPVSRSEWVSDGGTWEEFGFRPAASGHAFVCPELIDAQAAWLGMDDGQFEWWVDGWSLRLQLRDANDVRLPDWSVEQIDDLVDQQFAVSSEEHYSFHLQAREMLLADAAPHPQR